MPKPDDAARAPLAPPPTEASLHEAALAHLARYAASRAALARVLERRVDRWRRKAAETLDAETTAAAARAARDAVGLVVARLTAAGVIDDAAFAAARTSRLARAGRSRRAIGAHLAARGVAAAPEAISDEAELAAAVATARRRRIGPFRRVPADAAAARRELAAMARAGFAQEVARAALAMDPDAAEALIHRLRQT